MYLFTNFSELSRVERRKGLTLKILILTRHYGTVCQLIQIERSNCSIRVNEKGPAFPPLKNFSTRKRANLLIVSA